MYRSMCIGIFPHYMTATNATTLLTNSLTTFGANALIVLSAMIELAVALLIFHFGIKRLFTDKSLEIGGYYLRNTPFKGYKRFKSQKWNMEHMV